MTLTITVVPMCAEFKVAFGMTSPDCVVIITLSEEFGLTALVNINCGETVTLQSLSNDIFNVP